MRRALALLFALSIVFAPAFGAAQTGPLNSGGGSSLATPVAIADGGTATTALTNGRIPYYDGTSLIDSRLRFSGTSLILDSGLLVLPSGTAAAPTLQFAGLASAGMYYNAATFTFAQAGTNLISLDINNGPITVQRDAYYGIPATQDSTAAADVRLCRNAAGIWGIAGGACGTLASATAANLAATATISAANALHSQGTTFANLSAVTNGRIIHCTDCTPGAGGTFATCTGSGSGALAVRLNNAWSCGGS